MNLMAWRHVSYMSIVRLCVGVIISVLRRKKQDCIMRLTLYPHGVTVACRVSEIVPTL